MGTRCPGEWAARCSTTKTAAGVSPARCGRTRLSASIPPAEAPITMMSWVAIARTPHLLEESKCEYRAMRRLVVPARRNPYVYAVRIDDSASRATDCSNHRLSPARFKPALAANRQANAEFAPAARAIASGFDGRSVQFDQRFGQRQADAEPALRMDQRRLGLGEDLEQPRQHFSGDSDACVQDRDRDRISRRGRLVLLFQVRFEFSIGVAFKSVQVGRLQVEFPRLTP